MPSRLMVQGLSILPLWEHLEDNAKSTKYNNK